MTFCKNEERERERLDFVQDSYFGSHHHNCDIKSSKKKTGS